MEKYAVRCGGGSSHRYGLDDAILIKDNHIAVAGGIAEALRAAKAFAGHLVRVEIEVDTLQQFETDKREIEELVERRLRQKFAKDLAVVEDLSNPFNVGEHITISVRRGSQRQTFSGIFGGLVGERYVKLDSRHILLQDLNPADRDRLYWNNDQDRLDKLIDKRMAELKARMAKQRHALLHEANAERHYNTTFFKENVIVGNKIGKRHVFGDQTRIIVQTEDGNNAKLVVKTLSKHKLR